MRILVHYILLCILNGFPWWYSRKFLDSSNKWFLHHMRKSKLTAKKVMQRKFISILPEKNLGISCNKNWFSSIFTTLRFNSAQRDSALCSKRFFTLLLLKECKRSLQTPKITILLGLYFLLHKSYHISTIFFIKKSVRHCSDDELRVI